LILFRNHDQNFVNQEMDRIFKVLASKETDSISTKTINVKGRNVVLKKTCGGIYDATFQELCDQVN